MRGLSLRISRASSGLATLAPKISMILTARSVSVPRWRNPLESTQPTEILAPPPHTDLKNRPRNLPILQAMAIDSDGSLIFAPKFGTGTFSSLGQCAGPHKHGWHVLNIALIAAGSALVLVTLLALGAWLMCRTRHPQYEHIN